MVVLSLLSNPVSQLLIPVIGQWYQKPLKTYAYIRMYMHTAFVESHLLNFSVNIVLLSKQPSYMYVQYVYVCTVTIYIVRGRFRGFWGSTKTPSI